ncbi:hypothetical protein DY000_02006889 [Brassica cretica]|uniref:Chlorophyll a-b binding protein, chloroplastic n=1 Tax=Brassica cretica TaxID=69181 RepID=A0ABQ7CC74_BRACR|nr:hypothetical protein DY000_02006889 [Brassica cretica]
MSVRHNWLVCKLHTAPTVDKKALPSSREEFQFSLMSKTWKSTGILYVWQAAMISGSLILLEDICGFLTGMGS